jgi:plastocyanin
MRRISRRSLAFVLTLGLALILAAIGIGGSARADTTQATIVNYAFSPNPITISTGSTITWTNETSATTHTVTSDTGTFDSGGIAPSGGTFSHQFDQAGTFTYHCNIHPFMMGTIIVQQAASSPTATGTAAASTSTTVPPTPTLVPATPTNTPPPAKTPKASKKTFLAKPAGVTYRYRPTQIKVKVGSKITWKNASNTEHSVTSRTKAWKFNKLLKTKKSLSFVFHKTGTFKFYCRFHPGMMGKVVVHK